MLPRHKLSLDCKRESFTAFSTVRNCSCSKCIWRTTDDEQLTTFIQPHLLDIVHNRWFHELTQGLASGSSLANGCGRNRLVNLFQQMDVHAAQHQIPSCRLLLKWTRHLQPRTQALRQCVCNIRQGVTRPAGHDKLALTKQSLRLMPLGDVLKGIDADEQEEPVRFLERLLQASDGIDGVVGF